MAATIDCQNSPMQNKDKKTKKKKKIVIVGSETQVILDFLRIFVYEESFTSDPKRLILWMVKGTGKVFARNILLIVNFYLIALKSPQDPCRTCNFLQVTLDGPGKYYLKGAGA
ncbi:hypothetical protein QYF36_018950 [Acer negundo]|nr:hypothetical protein QYF36_018950 [Acer negundo]